MVAKLVAEEGLLKGLVLSFDEGEEWLIGRDPDSCQLLLEDPSASRKHLLCKATPEGITLKNLSETNPVEINDTLLTGSRLLKEGDMVRIGSGIYRFMQDSAESNPLAEEQAIAAKAPVEEEPRHDSVLELESEEAKKHPSTEVHFEVLETSRWLLKVIGGPNNGAEFSMNPGSTYIIGTDPNSCDIVFHDTSVSRQHARLSIQEDESMFLEDLKSRNGTLLDGDAIEGKTAIQPNQIITTGTTSFVVYDREGNMQTIISPLLPSIVKVLQKDGKSEGTEEAEAAPQPHEEHVPHEKSGTHLLFIAIVTGLFVLGALGTATLLRSEPVAEKSEVNVDKMIADSFVSYPSLKYSFNKSTGRLVMFGHLLNSQDKTQLLYSLQGLPFIKSIDDTGVIIDEYVWLETNQVLNKNPMWRTITLQSPTAGQFVLSGTLATKKQADQLYEYITTNFPYLDRLEKQVVVEEEIVAQVKSALDRAGILNTQVAFKSGDLTINGAVPKGKDELFNQLIADFKVIPGVRNVRSQVSSLAESQAMVNISDRYEVTGFSKIGKNINVVVNGRIVTKGDMIDGMAITEIAPGTVFLEKDGVKYRIDFSK
jgi:type III secretion system YscD/HrpQ family protein